MRAHGDGPDIGYGCLTIAGVCLFAALATPWLMRAVVFAGHAFNRYGDWVLGK